MGEETPANLEKVVLPAQLLAIRDRTLAKCLHSPSSYAAMSLPVDDAQVPSPWLTVPPKSSQQSNLMFLIKTFKHHWPFSMEQSYHYKFEPGDNTVYYYEI
jgi:hypothetical protein